MSPPSSSTVHCSRCGKEDRVPFLPTPGRPVYCRPCYDRASAPTPRKDARQVPRRMLAVGRKGHFVYDALHVLSTEEELDERDRRVLVEMVFTRGSRQTTEAAIAFLQEKQADGTLSADAHERLGRVVERYSGAR